MPQTTRDKLMLNLRDSLRLTVNACVRIVSRFGLSSLKQTKQRPVGSVGVEALLDHARRSFDNYCGVNGMRRAA